MKRDEGRKKEERVMERSGGACVRLLSSAALVVFGRGSVGTFGDERTSRGRESLALVEERKNKGNIKNEKTSGIVQRVRGRRAASSKLFQVHPLGPS